MLISNDQITKLSADEYLQFLVEVYFKFYENQEILLTVSNVRKQNVFSTKAIQTLFDYTAADKLGTTPLNAPYVKGYPHIARILNQATDYVINHRKSCNCIIFDFYKGVFGAMNIRIDAIFKGEEVAGIISRSFNFTKAYFEMNQCVKPPSAKGLKIETAQINTLTPRQKQVLFLGAPDMAHI